MKRLPAVLLGVVCVLLLGLLLWVAFVYSSQPDNDRYKGRSGQEQYCLDQGWKYVPETNSCKVR
jgi:hypothetical protein